MSKKKGRQYGGGKVGYDPLAGTKCHHKCKIHNEPCTVVMRYKDPKIQATVEQIRAIQGAPPHTEESHHYCELCALAMRENRTLDAYTRDKRGRPVLKRAGTFRMVPDDNLQPVWVGDIDGVELDEEEQANVLYR